MSDKLHGEIYNARKILLKQAELNGKTHTLSSLEEDFDLSPKGFLELIKDGAIVVKKCKLLANYINIYNKAFRKGLEPAYGSHNNGVSLKRTDCGLGINLYQEILDKGEAEVNILNFEKAIDDYPNPLECISFEICITPKLQDFLNKKLDLFIKDELDLSMVDIQSFYSYKKQKEQFSNAITKQINAGFPKNNLKIVFTEVWSKDIVICTNFIETALAMEKEGLIEIKDIIEDDVYKPLMQLHDLRTLLAWEHPTTIHLKVLPTFYAPQILRSKINECSDDEIIKIKTMLDVINIRLNIKRPPYIVYIPLNDFPDTIKRFEILALLYKIDRDLGGALRFTQITDGAEYSKQEVCIRVEDDKVKFNDFRKAIDVKYQNISDKSKPQKEKEEKTQVANLPINNKVKKYWIDYTTNRCVVLNGKYLINKMQFNRYSDVWFQYLYDNPNKNISLEEIRKKTTENGDDFIKFLNNIKFKGQLRELFFTQGKTGIIFHNPITEEDFNKTLIDVKKLEEKIKKLKKIKE